MPNVWATRRCLYSFFETLCNILFTSLTVSATIKLRSARLVFFHQSFHFEGMHCLIGDSYYSLQRQIRHFDQRSSNLLLAGDIFPKIHLFKLELPIISLSNIWKPSMLIPKLQKCFPIEIFDWKFAKTEVT